MNNEATTTPLDDNPTLWVSTNTVPDKLAGRLFKQLAVVRPVKVRAAGQASVYIAVRALMLASQFLRENGEENAELAASNWKWVETEYGGRCVEFSVELIEDAE